MGSFETLGFYGVVTFVLLVLFLLVIFVYINFFRIVLLKIFYKRKILEVANLLRSSGDGGDLEILINGGVSDVDVIKLAQLHLMNEAVKENDVTKKFKWRFWEYGKKKSVREDSSRGDREVEKNGPGIGEGAGSSRIGFRNNGEREDSGIISGESGGIKRVSEKSEGFGTIQDESVGSKERRTTYFS